ncbi:MAG TPA: hypothetical protein PK294_13775 [Ignavibacteria bacterium]|nr:hypothetical protein [Ignavibacteria bacterium]HRB01498.1 hypothetical protein [Ignavibacteria bacterium]
MKDQKSYSEIKTSRGYRLKISTHVLIEKIQKLINSSKDSVISNSVRLYYERLNQDLKKSEVNKKLSKKIKLLKK